MFTVEDIINVSKGKLVSGNTNFNCSGVSIDTRTIKPGELFIALEGKKFNGNNFIRQAFSKKASGVLCSDLSDIKGLDIETGRFIVHVKDTLYSLGELAKFHRIRCNPKVIAITGSVGKTTTKDFISDVLSSRFNTFKNFGTQNNLIGVPINILKINKTCQILILELGSNKPGEISSLSKICEPDIGVVLNIGPSHLKYLKSLDGVKKEKLGLLKYLRNGGCAIINLDFLDKKDIKLLNKKTGRIITIGIKKDADFKAYDINFTEKGVSFKVNGIEYSTNLFNIGYVYNVLACLAVASIFNIDTKISIESVLKFKSISSRFKRIDLKGVIVLDDTYNSNPISMEYAIEAMVKLNGKRNILVCADMLELGEYSKKYHLNIGKIIANSGIDLLFLVGEFSKYVKDAALSKGMKPCDIKIFSSIEEARSKIPSYIKNNDLVLVKGSRAMEMEKVVDELKLRFKAKQ